MLQPKWDQVVFADEANRSTLSKATAAGRMQRLGRGIYTPSLDAPERVVRRHHWQIVAHEFPGAIVVDRSARSSGPDDQDRLTVVHKRERELKLPGLRIMPRSGPGPLPGDTALPVGLWLSSQERALLDNLSGHGERYLSDEEVEHWIVDIASQPNGEQRLNDLRDRARDLAEMMGRPAAFRHLSALISAAMATGSADELRTKALRVRATGGGYDRIRIERFRKLVDVLSEFPPDPLPALPVDEPRRALLPFYEAYFSNYIEGTEFTLNEAAAIVFDDQVPPERPKDAHDIQGTYRLLADKDEMRRTPRDGDELVELLLRRHGVMMAARPEVGPGRFKDRANQAGSTLFVLPELVEDTLREAFEVGRSVIDPFARAAYLTFLVSEVHPFADGNGRMARVIMNAELVAASEVRIIIPTVFRLNYLSALKGATHNDAFSALLAMLRFAQRYTARIDFSSRLTAEEDLTRTNALRDPEEAENYGVRLLPA